jgi:hypothetical protein
MVFESSVAAMACDDAPGGPPGKTNGAAGQRLKPMKSEMRATSAAGRLLSSSIHSSSGRAGAIV